MVTGGCSLAEPNPSCSRCSAPSPSRSGAPAAYWSAPSAAQCSPVPASSRSWGSGGADMLPARRPLLSASGDAAEGLRWPPGWGWGCGRAGVWPAAGTGSRRRCLCWISTSAYYAGENGLLVGAFQPLRHPVAGISQGRNLPAGLLLSPPFNCFGRVGIGLCG